MATEATMSSSVYSVVELIGSSPDSWEQATANAIEEASRSVASDLRVAEVIEMDVLIEEGKVLAYRSKVRLSYKPTVG
jgi:flavin-binding protein dodecin